MTTFKRSNRKKTTTGFSLSVVDESFACLSPMGHIWGFSIQMPRLGLTQHVSQSQQGFALPLQQDHPLEDVPSTDDAVVLRSVQRSSCKYSYFPQYY